MAVLPRVTPAGVEPARPRVRAGSSAVLSYGAMMWPAGVEPATPRVSGGRSTGLSYDHVRLAPKSRLGREAADFRDLRDSGSASDPESCDGRNRRGWARTSGLLFVREALSPLSYSPVRCGGASAAKRPTSGVLRDVGSARRIRHPAPETPGQGIEPRPPRSERGVLPVRRSRNACLSVHPPFREIDAAGKRRTVGSWSRPLSRPPKANDVFCATRQPFDPGSSCDGCAAGTRRPTWRGFGARASALYVEKSRQKQMPMRACLFTRC